MIYLACGIVALMLLDKIPGLKHLIKPVIDSLSFIFTTFFGSLGAWMLWFVKMIGTTHYILVLHMAKNRDSLDPTEMIERTNKRGGVDSEE
jgi:hypothetical protein